MKETKIFLTEQENQKLIEVAKENGQSKVKFCTVHIKNVLKKVNKTNKQNHEKTI